MKKITLSVIILFLTILIIVFIGDQSSQNESLEAVPKNNITNSQKSSNANSTPSTGNKIPTKNNRTYDINPPNININNASFEFNKSNLSKFTLLEVSKHNTGNDCYLIINNNVYDVSSYIGYHPGGASVIISRCGREVTGIFARIHSNRAWDLLKKYKIGTVGAKNKIAIDKILNTIFDALSKANPKAEIINVKPGKGFYVAKIIYNGNLYEIHMNNNGKIIKEEITSDESNWSLWWKDRDDK